MDVDVVVNVDEIKACSSTTRSTFTSTIDALPSTDGLRSLGEYMRVPVAGMVDLM